MNCKLIGQFVQYLEVTLAPGEEFYSERGSVIYLDNGVEKETVLNGSGLGRILSAKFSGESLFILRLFNTDSQPRTVGIGSQCGILPIKLNGESIICHRGVYIGSSAKVDVSTKFSIAGFTGGMGFMLQRIQGRATVFLDTIGQPIVKNLQYGESISLDENHIIALQGISEGQMQPTYSVSNFLGGEGLSMLRVTGPGTVYLSPSPFMPARTDTSGRR